MKRILRCSILAIGMVAAAATVAPSVGFAASGTSATHATAPATSFGAYCPEKAPPGGIYLYSFVGADNHHYDVYLAVPPLTPFRHDSIDCDA